MRIIDLSIHNLIGTGEEKKSHSNVALTELKQSLLENGLLNPIIVRFVEGTNNYIIVDGHKRVQIIKQLIAVGRLGGAYSKLPCTIELSAKVLPLKRRRPQLLSDSELAHLILFKTARGHNRSQIASELYCDKKYIDDARSLRELDPRILKHFNDGMLSLEQAAAFATIPHSAAQYQLLLGLGPFVSRGDIIRAIRSGETMLELPDGEYLVLPSRKSKTQKMTENVMDKALKAS